MISPAEADALIAQHTIRLPIESRPLLQCAGAVLREDIQAERDHPPFDRVAMDGYAVATGGLRRADPLIVQAMQAAGDPPLTLISPDHAIEIMTGAVLPRGCDAVIPVEQSRRGPGADGDLVTFDSAARVTLGQNIHRRGSDVRQGTTLLTAGMQLGAPEVAVAAGAGRARLLVSARPAVSVVSTGNELVEPDAPIADHQVRRSNAYGLIAALLRQGCTDIADDHLPDEAEALTARLGVLLDTRDVLVLSGGVSAGRLDLVPAALAALGVRQVFHKVAQRPGKPLWFGVAPSGTLVFALPGNPVSTLACLARYVLPTLDAMGGPARPVERIALATALEQRVPLTALLPVRVVTDDAGRRWAQPCPTNGSGDYAALTGTDGVIELPPGPASHPQGAIAHLYRW